MSFFLNAWRRIGARLYLALGFSVLLTVFSGSLGVWYFERAGDSIALLDSGPSAALELVPLVYSEARMVERVGWRALAGRSGLVDRSVVDASLGETDRLLAGVIGSPGIDSARRGFRDVVYDLAGLVDELLLLDGEIGEAEDVLLSLSVRVSSLPMDSREVLQSALAAGSVPELDELWPDMSVLPVDPELVQEVYAVWARRLALQDRREAAFLLFQEGLADLSRAELVLQQSTSGANEESVDAAAASFDNGRFYLTAISVVGILAATLVAWFWVGRGVVLRLSRLSERMRGMARGDIDTPVPEVGRDEIGELAGALEVWRQQAIEVQRLNLVEKLYGELREAHDELGRMQERLVAQEKLAALGELVSGVAHEISNPLNFVKNFSEGSQELCVQLSDMIGEYRAQMTDDDQEYLDEILVDLNDSLGRVQSNGGRALAIVDRMRGLGITGGALALSDLNGAVSRGVQTGCESFLRDWPEFQVEQVLRLDPEAGETMMVQQDFGEAMMNLVQNACYAMQLRSRSQADYQAELLVSTLRTPAGLEIRVRDNGTGISEDVLGHIFNPFFSTRDGVLGAGLGLPISQDILRRLGGHLTVDTVPGDYTEFLVELPLAELQPGGLAEEMSLAVSP